jgi:hypothetical protein
LDQDAGDASDGCGVGDPRRQALLDTLGEQPSDRIIGLRGREPESSERALAG